MITFFINLDDATSRRSKFKDTDYKRWKATPRKDVPLAIDNKMISRYNFPREAHLGRCGCFLSHTKLLEHIVDNKIDNVLILEDDAIKINEIPIDYPKDSGGINSNNPFLSDEQKEILENNFGEDGISTDEEYIKKLHKLLKKELFIQENEKIWIHKTSWPKTINDFEEIKKLAKSYNVPDIYLHMLSLDIIKI